MANSKIVPGQWAEYCAPSGSPDNPRPTEYNRAIKAIMIGYHLLIKFIMRGIIF